MLRNIVGVGGCPISLEKYEEVSFIIISVTGGWIGVKLKKKGYVTLEWPLYETVVQRMGKEMFIDYSETRVRTSGESVIPDVKGNDEYNKKRKNIIWTDEEAHV